MGQLLIEILGYIILTIACAMAVWEYRAYHYPDDEEWLCSRSRYRRRLLVALALGVIGALLAAEARGLILTEGRPGVLLAYAGAILALCMLLLVLAFLDLNEIARRAADRAMKELADAVARQKQIEESERKMPPEQEIGDR